MIEPFHTSAPVAGWAPSYTRRLLLISYHFPPSTKIGGRRWLRMAKYAADAEWGMDVLTLHPGDLSTRDDRLLDELPPGTRVFGVAASNHPLVELTRRASSLFRRRTGRRSVSPDSRARPAVPKSDSLGRDEIALLPPTPERLRRLYLSWVEHRVDQRWSDAVARAGSALLGDAGQHYGAIVSCGPPHMVHTAAADLARRFRIPHVIDMRDPWSMVERIPEWSASPYWIWRAARDERRAVEGAQLVVANTERAAAALRSRYPRHSARILSVMNGFDEVPVTTGAARSRFMITYAGSIYLDRDPRLLFRAVASMTRELGLAPAQLGLEFIGSATHFQGVPIEHMARDEGLEGYVTVRPAMPVRELLSHLSGSSVLVILPQDSSMAIPSKAFEYMLFDAWVLVLAERDSATGELFAPLDADLVAPTDVAGMARALGRRYEQFRAGERAAPLCTHAQFSRRQQAARLLAAMHALGTGADTPAGVEVAHLTAFSRAEAGGTGGQRTRATGGRE